jgi:hypothetical protein
MVEAYGILLRHTIPPLGLRDGAAIREHKEWHVGVVSQKESYFLPPDGRVRHRKAEVRIDSQPRLDKGVHIAPHCRFRVRALP